MDIVLPLCFAAVAVTAFVLRLLSSGAGGAVRPRLEDWREAARKAGLTEVEASRGTLGGKSGGLYVRLSRYSDSSARGTRITVSGPGLPPDLTVCPEGTALHGARGAREMEVGHDTFDAAAWIQGPPALVRALLDPDARRAIRALFDGRLERAGRSPFWATGRIDEGVLRVDVPEVVPKVQDPNTGGQSVMPAVGNDYVARPEQLGDVLAEILALARLLAPPDDVARRLADNLKREPVAGVRRQCVTTLVREFPDHPAIRDALLAAREDPDAEVRVRAAIALGPEGRDTLLAVAGGEGAEDDTTARAVAALGGHLTTPQAQDLLRSALRTRREATARACLSALARRRGEGVATLAKVLAIETPSLASAAAEALGETADTRAETPLLAALGSPHSVVRAAAARALGAVGTAAAVQPLKEAEAGDHATRTAARQAIAEIQARLKGAAPGQLSLAGGQEGQLSLAGEEQGRLSLPAEPSRPGETGVPRDDRVKE